MGPCVPRVPRGHARDRATPVRSSVSIPARSGVIGALPRRIAGRPGANARPHHRVARLETAWILLFFLPHRHKNRTTRSAFRLRAAGKRPASSARLTNSFLPPLRRRDGRVHEGPVQAGRGRALGTSRDRPRERNEARAFSPFVQTSQTRARRSPQPEAKRDETRDGSDEISRRFSRARPDEPSPRTSATHITDRSKSATCYPSGTRT